MKKILFALIVIIVSLFIVFHYAKSQSNAIIELNSDYSWNWVGGSPTPAVITNTPGPSQTPWIITATPEAILTFTPTQEILPTDTPMPTVTPISECYAKVNTNLNVRETPGTNTTILGTMPPNIYVPLYGYWVYNGIKWYQHYWVGKVGYSHSGYMTIPAGVDCSGLKDVTPPNPSHNVSLLWHTIPGFNWNNAAASYGILQAKSIDFGIKPFTDIDKCVYTLEEGGTCIYRHGWPDCPLNIGEGNATESALNFLLANGTEARIRLAGYEKAYYEPLNECNYGSPNSAVDMATLHWWSDWLLAYVKAAHDGGWPKLVIPTFGPASAYKEHYIYWKQVYVLSASYGNLNGEHIYTPYHDRGLCPEDIWLADRYRLDEQWRVEQGIRINVAITEVAPGWGNDPVNVADFVCWYNRVRKVPYISSVALWTMGYNPTWPNPNLDNYVVAIAYNVAPAPMINSKRFTPVLTD